MVFGVLLSCALAGTSARAQAPAAEPAPATQPEAMTPPSLRDHPEAAFPRAALDERAEGNVGLEIDLDATGAVVGVRVVRPAGHGFDEAAAEAARHFTFDPAKRRGVAVPSTVQFTYEFHLPPEPPPAPPSPAPAPAAPASPAFAAAPVQEGLGQSTLVLGSKPLSAASSFSLQDRDFQLRPIGSVQDILRVTPGLVTVQHSGGGKANQYFLRGFDADHGTDLALSIDGVPINLVSHAHGQGFADTNFIIPEVVERVEITKGPYFASQGDFATAGAVNMVSRDEFEHSSVAAGLVGSPGHGQAGYRGLAIASPKLDGLPLKATFAAEIGRTNGPFENPDGWDRYKLFNKLAWAPSPTSSVSVTEMSYAGNWHGSGQIPARAVAEGLISRFGSLDPDEGGNTARHQIALAYRLRPNESSELRALAYAAAYRFNLFSDFTLYLRDPVDGDEIEQVDRRTFYGAKVSYRVVRHAGRVSFDTTIGGDVRSDDIHEELWDTVHRQQVTAVRSNDVHESFIGAYLNEEIAPFALGARRSRRARRSAVVRGRQPLAVVRPDCAPERRRRRAPAQPQGEPDPDAARSAARRAGSLRQLRPRLSLQRRARRVRAAGGHAAGARDRRGARRARPPLRPLGSGASQCGSSTSTARRSGTATTAPPRSAARPTGAASSSRAATSSCPGWRPTPR